MSERMLAGPPSPAEDAERLAAALASVPLFAGMSHEDVLDFASVFRPVSLSAGEVLWRQATPVDGLHILLSGEVRVSRRLPGERDIEVARLGPGAVMGEIPLLDGGTHSGTVRADSPCSLVFLHRRDFHARTDSGHRSALALKRHIVETACARVRADHAWLGDALAGESSPVPGRGASVRPLPLERAVATPSPEYASRLPFFTHLDPDLVASLLDRGKTLRLPPRHVLLAEGETPGHCCITLNGAVEDVLQRVEKTVRVRLAGPGRAFGYLGLLDGGPASATSVTRERAIVLAIEGRDLTAALQAGDDLARGLAAAIEHDLMGTLRSTAAPKAHLTAAVA